MVSISETVENQSHHIQHNIEKHRQQQKEIQEQLIKSVQLYHIQHNKIMSENLSSQLALPSTTTDDTVNKTIENSENIENEETEPKIIQKTIEVLETTAITPKKNTNKLISTKPPKCAVSQSSIDIEIDKTSSSKPRNLRLDLITTKSEEQKVKSPKTPKSPLSAAGRLSHQTSLSSQIDIVEDRKTLRDALYQGIFHRHRKTIFAMGSFLRMLRSRNSQYNTIRSSSEDQFDLQP